MNHAASAVTSLNPEPVKVGDVAGQRAQRRGLLQGAVRPVVVEEVLVLEPDALPASAGDRKHAIRVSAVMVAPV